MVNLWVTKVKYKLSNLEDVSPWYYDQVKAELVKQGIYDAEGNRLK